MGGPLEEFWNYPVERGPGPESYTCQTAGKQGPQGGPFHRQNRFHTCTPGQRKRGRTGDVSMLLAWAASGWRYLLQESSMGCEGERDNEL